MKRTLVLLFLSSSFALSQTATLASAEKPSPATPVATEQGATAQQSTAAAQPAQATTAASAQSAAPTQAVQTTLTVPSGTTVMLKTLDAISTKTARVGDRVYFRSSFPVAIDNHMAIPAGTYVDGEITNLKRPGRVKGRAEIAFRFDKMIFPSGYTVQLPGAVRQVPDLENAKIKDKEGTIEQNPNTGRDVGTIAAPAAEGTLIGLAADGARGAGIGAGIGAAAGVLITMITRGDDIRLEPGTSVEMVTHRPIEIDMHEVRANSYDADWDRDPGPVISRTQQPRKRPIPVLMPPIGTPY
jgi:type IV secretion system protein VirB10